MKTADWKDTSVGKIVAENFAAAKVFKNMGLIFVVMEKLSCMKLVQL